MKSLTIDQLEITRGGNDEIAGACAAVTGVRLGLSIAGGVSLAAKTAIKGIFGGAFGWGLTIAAVGCWGYLLYSNRN